MMQSMKHNQQKIVKERCKNERGQGQLKSLILNVFLMMRLV
jgi:hypothetical protein